MKSVLQCMRLKRAQDRKSKSSTVRSVMQFCQCKHRSFAPCNTIWKGTVNLLEEQYSVLRLAWVLICKHHELTSGVSTEKHRVAGGWRLHPGAVEQSSHAPCCLCPIMLEEKWRLRNSREVGKTTLSYRAFVLKCLLTLLLYSQESWWQKKILTFH